MTDKNSINYALNNIGGVLFVCFVVGVLVLAVWLLMVIGIPEWVWQKHGEFFGLTHEQVALVHYGGLLITKMGIFVFFLFPYMGIKLVLRKQD